eukprot:4268656-Pyramimonas_sp.AAC.1
MTRRSQREIQAPGKPRCANVTASDVWGGAAGDCRFKYFLHLQDASGDRCGAKLVGGRGRRSKRGGSTIHLLLLHSPPCASLLPPPSPPSSS